MYVPKRALGLFLLVFFLGTGISVYLGVNLGLGAGRPTESGLVALTSARTAADVTPTTCPDASAGPVAAAASADGTDQEGGTGGQSESTYEQGDFATNSGTIAHSQFNDGGFGDIGQQWWNVTVNGTVTNVHVSGGDATVTIGPDGNTTTPATVAPVEAPAATPTPTTAVPTDTTPPPTTPASEVPATTPPAPNAPPATEDGSTLP